MEQTSLTLDTFLEGSIDIDELVKSIPDSYVLKGMFFSRHVQRLGPDFVSLKRALEHPPRNGYLPFIDYPQRDYARIQDAVATKLFPSVSQREALRRTGREDFRVFADSMMGRVVVAMIGDARAALHRTPGLYMKMAPGDWQIRAHDLDDTTVRMQFTGLIGDWVVQAGQLEGIVLGFGGTPRLLIEDEGDGSVRFDVSFR